MRLVDPVQPPDTGSPARTARTVAIAIVAAVVTVALGVVTSVLVFGLPNAGSPAPPQTRPVTAIATTTPPGPLEPSPRVTIVIREPATITAETVLGAIASAGTLLAGVGTLLAAVAALRTTRAGTTPGRQRKRSKNRRR